MQLKSLIIVILAIALVGAFALYKLNTNEEIQNGHMDETEEFEIRPGVIVGKIENGEDFILLDVRNPEEYEEIHIENSILVPVQELSQQTLNDAGIGEDSKDKEIVIYCRSGARSKQAYDIMKSLGYTNIKSVAGGMIHWQEDEYPFTESGKYDGQLSGKQQVQTQSAAQIQFDRDVHDFGVIPQSGGIVTATFTVSNTGSGNLLIGDITTSCSCTSATISSSNIGAGEEALLEVRFDPDFHEEPEGEFSRTVFIPSNDTSMPEAEVRIKVDIEENQ